MSRLSCRVKLWLVILCGWLYPVIAVPVLSDIGCLTVLPVLGIKQAAIMTRDISLYIPIRTKYKSRLVGPPLCLIARDLMGLRIQCEGRIDSVCSSSPSPGSHTKKILQLEDARAAMDIYKTSESQWEGSIRAGTWPSALAPERFSRYYS